MRKYLQIYFMLTLLLLTTVSRAQDFIGYSSGNYAGINGLMYNPASVVDSRFKADVNIINANFALGNNYASFDKSTLFVPNYWNNFDFSGKFINFEKGKKDYAFINNVNIQGPGALITLTKKDAIAISSSIRNVINFYGAEQPLVDIAFSNTADQWYTTPLSNKNLQFQANVWAEYGFTYGRVIFDKGEHFLKGGITVKYLQGMGSAYMNIEDFRYEYNGGDSIQAFHLDAQYGHSSNVELTVNDQFKYQVNSSPSFGGDIGFVYEWRPKHGDYHYTMDGKENLDMRDKNKYKIRAGISLIDVGFLKYKRSPDSYDFNVDLKNIPLSAFGFFTDLNSLDTVLHKIGATHTQSTGSYTQRLPMALSIQLDYSIGKGFYLNATPFIGFYNGFNSTHSNHVYGNYAFTPRWEDKWFGVYLPNSYHTLNGWNSGFALRLGPLTIGSGTIIGNLVKSKMQNFDIYVGLKASIPYGRKRDRDKDQVSDKLDKCRETQGVWAFKGCPDTDNDGVEDSEDLCPKEAGVKELKGCPDSDSDGIADKDDDCPKEAGLAEMKGCPDRDNDNIIDSKDECPDQKGLGEFGGCPDIDHDGLPDKNDGCPNLSGPKENFGCPDRDGDGVTDDKDYCPDEAGLSDNNGCPAKDRDKDGVADEDDRCPDKEGPADNGGCPKVTDETASVIKSISEKLEFMPAKAVILNTSFPSLDQLATILIKNPDYTLLVEGHTDNVGKAESNLLLSKNRANAVKAYLVKKGVSTFRIITRWYGQTKPIASNDTEEGKKKNRRVDMTVIFE